jgi:hypothetical protein
MASFYQAGMDPIYDYLVEFNLERYTPSTHRKWNSNQPFRLFEKNNKNGYLNPSQIRNSRPQWEPTSKEQSFRVR